MKRTILLFLVLGTLFCAFGCDRKDEIESPVNFYYFTDPVNYNVATGVISAEIRDQSGHRDLLSLLNLYVKGPVTSGFRSPFPAGIQVLKIDCQPSSTVVRMNDAFAALSGHNLTLACACISKTVMDLTGCTSVRIQTESLPLDANAYIEMTNRDFLFLDEYIPESQP